MLNSYLLLMQVLQETHNETRLESVENIINSLKLHEEIHTITYFGQLEAVSDYINVASGIPKLVLTSLDASFEFYEEGGFNKQIIFIAITDIKNKVMRPQILYCFQNVQAFTRALFIIPAEVRVSKKDLRDHFKWCWRNGFADSIVLTTSDLKVYGFNSFPEMSIHEFPLTLETNYFPSKLNNMRGKELHTPLQFDPPRVFTTATKNCGYALKLMLEFLKIRNGSLVPIISPQTVYNIQDIIAQLNEGHIQVSVHPFYPVSGVHISYPLRMTKWRLLVPSKGEAPLYLYYLYPFQLSLWLMLSVTVSLIGLVFYVWQLIPRQQANLGKRRADFTASILFVLRLLLNQPTPMYKVCTLWLPYIIFLWLIIIFGFLLINLYLATLTSFFATTIWNQQLNTMQDLVRENMSVHVGAFEKKVIMRNYALPKGFVELLVPSSTVDMVKDVLNLTAGQAYAAREDLLGFSLEQVKLDNNPSYRFAEEYITTLPVGYLLPTHSQFEVSLNIFIMQCDAAGLLVRWIAESKHEAFQAGILKMRKSKALGPAPMKANRLLFAWMILGFGWSIAAFVFLLEKTIKHLTRLRFQLHYE